MRFIKLITVKFKYFIYLITYVKVGLNAKAINQPDF